MSRDPARIAQENLRGAEVVFAHPTTGTPIPGKVQTHIRHGRWQIIAARLPHAYSRGDGSRRIVLARSEFTLAPPPVPGADQ